MLTESSFVLNHWITILWIIAAGLYTLYAVVQDLIKSRKGGNESGTPQVPF